MPKTEFVQAYSKSTGERRSIPSGWLEIDAPPFNDYQLEPPNEAKASTVLAAPAVTTPAPPASKKETK